MCGRNYQKMKKTDSLKQNFIFRALYRRGRQVSCKTMVVYLGKNRLKTKNRLGFTVSTKLGCAVTRNRIRRRLREVYRLNEDCFTPGWDIVVVARSRCIDASFPTLTKAYLTLAEKAGILKEQIK